MISLFLLHQIHNFKNLNVTLLQCYILGIEIKKCYYKRLKRNPLSVATSSRSKI